MSMSKIDILVDSINFELGKAKITDTGNHKISSWVNALADEIERLERELYKCKIEAKTIVDFNDELQQRIAELEGVEQRLYENLNAQDSLIDQLKQRIAELEAEADPQALWISVDERLPDVGQYVVVMADRYWNVPDGIPEMKVTAVGYLNDGGNKYWSIFGERGMELDSFTHWMPLPQPPSDKGE